MSSLAVRARLGADFRKFWYATTVSNIGDGITMVATPLLVAALTDDPGLVAGAAFATQLPWLLLALISGAYADRWDRRRVIIVVNCVRGSIMAGIAVTRTPIVAGAILVLFGIHTMVWGVLIRSLRQRLVPDGLRGRIGSVFSLLDLGGAAVGTLLGGVIAHAVGLVTPFWLAAAGMAVLTAIVWPRFSNEALKISQ